MPEQLIGSVCQNVKNIILSLKLDTNTVFLSLMSLNFFHVNIMFLIESVQSELLSQITVQL